MVEEKKKKTKGKKERKLKVSKLTKTWEQKDWQKFSKWWTKQEFKLDEFIFLDMPKRRSLKAGDKIRGMHIKEEIYKKTEEYDVIHHLKRQWAPILIDEILNKETAQKLNIFFSFFRDKSKEKPFRGMNNLEYFKLILTATLFLIKYCYTRRRKEYYTPIDLTDFLDSDFLKFLLGKKGLFFVKVIPEFPVANIDRVTSDELLPLFLTKGIFSNFNNIPHIQDLADEEAKKIKRKLTAKERRDLEVKTKEYKKGGYVWKEFPQYAIGFGYEQFTEYLDKVENEYQEKQKQAEVKPFLFPDMQREIEEVLRKVRLYKKGQSLAYGILGEAYLQRKWLETELSKEKAVYYIGKTPEQKEAYQQVKKILNSLRWLSYKVIGRGNSKLKGAIGNFIFNIQEKGDKYLLDINPRYVGCIQNFAEDKELHNKQKRKELFSSGYFGFPMKALAISGDYSTATEELRNYFLREKGNSHLNTKNHKVISQKVKVYINRAYLGYKQRSKNYQVFVNEILPTLKRDKFISKLEPSLNKLKALSPKRGYEVNLKVYMKHIKELDKNLGELLKKRNLT
ncbi:MAG: hypothetical protein U9O41_00510 [Candidatus Aerophobetes bacterium]|nr:hypothetical protein [Candidatus Aerophobetes bacterium]